MHRLLLFFGSGCLHPAGVGSAHGLVGSAPHHRAFALAPTRRGRPRPLCPWLLSLFSTNLVGMRGETVWIVGLKLESQVVVETSQDLQGFSTKLVGNGNRRSTARRVGQSSFFPTLPACLPRWNGGLQRECNASSLCRSRIAPRFFSLVHTYLRRRCCWYVCLLFSE